MDTHIYDTMTTKYDRAIRSEHMGLFSGNL